MKKFSLSVLSVSLMAMMPVIAGAAGTYYNGDLYKSPQRYGADNGGYYNRYGNGRGYGQSQSMTVRNTTTKVTKKTTTKQKAPAAKQGLKLDMGLSHEFASWKFEMKDAGSKLYYDDLSWNVISGEGTYYFDTSTPVQVKFGARYGKQYGESLMVDDDITTRKMWEDVTDDNNAVIGINGMPAISVGSSEGGTQMGFNAAFGLTDFFSNGKLKVTPSIGYRYFKYNLETKNNYGTVIEVLELDGMSNCQNYGGETQCSPYVGFMDVADQVIGYANLDDGLAVPAGTAYLDLGSTYYYAQPGVSHKYEVEWSGPYVALDLEYNIDDKNLVSAGVEFGLPKYTATGDQPYRVDWEHPKSVQDKAGFGDAYHLGFNAMWSTLISDSVMFDLGLTYDYYTVKNADATTYISKSYYENAAVQLQETIDYLIEHSAVAEQIAAYQTQLDYVNLMIDEYKAIDWKMKSKKEVKSIYSSMGIRAGLTVKF